MANDAVSPRRSDAGDRKGRADGVSEVVLLHLPRGADGCGLVDRGKGRGEVGAGRVFQLVSGKR